MANLKIRHAYEPSRHARQRQTQKVTQMIVRIGWLLHNVFALVLDALLALMLF